MAAAAGTFDPDGLYADETARDFAVSLIAETFPDLDVSIYVVRTVERDKGKWSRRSWWVAACNDPEKPSDCAVAGAATPTVVAQDLIQRWQKAHGRIRPHPECRALVAAEFETFGQIYPADVADYRALQERTYGKNNCIVVEADGRVMLASGRVEAPEAYDIGQAVADFIHDRTPGATAAEASIKTVVEERSGGLFKGVVILTSDERVEVPGVLPSRLEALEWAERAKRALRSTIAARAVVEASTLTAA